jgi:colicin import membrane protein
MSPDEQQLKFQRYVKYSLILHGMLFALFFMGDWIWPSSKSPLMMPTVQIDMVALPDQVKSQSPPVLDTTLPVKENPPPPAEPPSEKDLAMPVPDPPKRDTQADAKKALERLRANVQKERAQETAKEQREKARQRQETLEQRQRDLKRFEQAYRAAIRGNQTNQGSSATGAMEATLNAYAGHITDKLRSNWALPAYLQGRGMRAVARIYIDGRGQVVRFQLVQSSGNEVFDEYVKGSIQRSSPFAPPPADMANGLRNSGLEVIYPL